MALILAMSVAKFFDPIFFILALTAVCWLRSWWGVILVGLLLACLYQALLGDGRGYAFVAACIAMMMQVSPSFGIYRTLHGFRGKRNVSLLLSLAAVTVGFFCYSLNPIDTVCVKATGCDKASEADDLETPIPGLVQGSEDDLIGREPKSKAERLEREANTVVPGLLSPVIPDSLELFGDSAVRSFRSGGNLAYELFKRGERAWYAPPSDPTFKPDDFIARHRHEIPGNLEMQYHLAGSEDEANLILSNMQQKLQDQEILFRRAGRRAQYRRPTF